NNSVEHALNAFVFEGRTAQHGLNFASDGTQTQTFLDLFFGQLAGFEILVHQLFVGFSSRLNQLFAPFVSDINQIGRDVDVLELHALSGFIPDDALNFDEVDNTLELVFGANRYHDRYGVGFQTCSKMVVNLEEV